MLKEIVIAIQSYALAHQFILKNKLWKWILIPGIIYALLFTVSMYFFSKSANNFIEWILKASHLNVWLLKTNSSLLSFLLTFDALVLWLVLMLFYFSLFKYTWLIVGSPVFAFLSEKTEAILENRNYPFNFSRLVKDILRGISVAFRNAFWQTIYTVSILLLALIPVAGWVTPVIAVLVECYYYGFSMIDYRCERKQINMQQSIVFIGNHKGLAIGNGIVFYLMHIVPFIGWILAPAYAVIASSLSMYEVKENPVAEVFNSQ